MSVIHTVHDRDKRTHQSQSRWDGRGSNIFTFQDPRLDEQPTFAVKNGDISSLMADVIAAKEHFDRESLALEHEIQQLNKNIARLQKVLHVTDREIDLMASRSQWGIMTIIQTVSRRFLGSRIAVNPVDQQQTIQEDTPSIQEER